MLQVMSQFQLSRSEVRWNWNKSLNLPYLPFSYLEMKLVLSPISQGPYEDLTI